MQLQNPGNIDKAFSLAISVKEKEAAAVNQLKNIDTHSLGCSEEIKQLQKQVAYLTQLVLLLNLVNQRTNRTVIVTVVIINQVLGRQLPEKIMIIKLTILVIMPDSHKNSNRRCFRWCWSYITFLPTKSHSYQIKCF